MIENEYEVTRKIVEKPHISHAAIWICVTIMVCFCTYFGLEYKKTFDRMEVEIRNIDLDIKDKEVRLEHLRAVKNVGTATDTELP